MHMGHQQGTTAGWISSSHYANLGQPACNVYTYFQPAPSDFCWQFVAVDALSHCLLLNIH